MAAAAPAGFPDRPHRRRRRNRGRPGRSCLATPCPHFFSRRGAGAQRRNHLNPTTPPITAARDSGWDCARHPLLRASAPQREKIGIKPARTWKEGAASRAKSGGSELPHSGRSAGPSALQQAILSYPVHPVGNAAGFDRSRSLHGGWVSTAGGGAAVRIVADPGIRD